VREAFRSRVRRARRVLQALHQVRRRAGEDAAEHQRELYARLLAITRQTVRQAERVRAALAQRVRGAAPTAPERLARRLQTHLEPFLPLVARGMHQAQARVLAGQPVPSAQKVLSLFEPHTRVVKRGKIGAAVEFGRQVVLDEVEGGIVTRVHVLADDQRECHQAVPAVRHHRAGFGRPPWLVAGDRRLHTKGVEDQAQVLGVAQVAIPRTGRLTAAQRARERQRAWKRRYRWRAGIEGRIHRLRRDYGLARSRSHGEEGLARDVGWGVLASNLRHIAQKQAAGQTVSASIHNRAA
jgi:IS5 family transposase